MKAPERDRRKGILACYTGDGKGKSTAAFGSVLRAAGYGWKVCIIQFVKGSWEYGEMEGLKRLAPEVELHVKGRGFYKIIDDKLPPEEHREAARDALDFAHERMLSDDYDLLILDELNVAVSVGLLEIESILELLAERPAWLHIIITGRGAHKKLIDVCDLVTEMTEIKHPFREGIKAQKGFDY